MIIAIDAMGGDYAPKEIVRGALLALKQFPDVTITLIGDETKIKAHLPKNFLSSRLLIKHTSEAIAMNEKIASIRNHRNSSVVLAARMAKDGLSFTSSDNKEEIIRADAMVGVGNTGFTMSAATLFMGRIEGVSKPAIATILPGVTTETVFLDAGAMADCEPENLRQFAIMGKAYSEKILGVADPTIAILSIGEEPEKGNTLTINSSKVLKNEFGDKFIGNIEGRDLLLSVTSVAVTDGFTGNVSLKILEGFKLYLKSIVKKDKKMWLFALLAFPFYLSLKKRLDPNKYGGAPLLGVAGVCIIGHGNSNAEAIFNAINAARKAVNSKLVEAITNGFRAKTS